MRHKESALQSNCVRWFGLQYPELKELFFAVPNGGSRNKIEAVRLKMEGVRAGVADCILLVSRKGFGALCVEFKVGKNKQTALQERWQKQAEKHGNKYVECRDLDEFMDIINEYLK